MPPEVPDPLPNQARHAKIGNSSDEMELLKRVYNLFNARDMEGVLRKLHEDVMWANGMEGGHVHGRDGVRQYWTRQWAMMDPHVEPVEFSRGLISWWIKWWGTFFESKMV